jgi:DNA-binding transcriptional LysR family regulator
MRLLESYFLEAGLRPEFVFRSDDNGTVQAMVAAGFGVAVVPRLTVNLEDAATVAISLGDVVPPRRIVLVWHRDRYRSPAVLAFVELAADVCAEFAGAGEPATSARAV